MTPRAHVYGIYSGKTPFLYARDGEYEGVKGDAVDICDGIRIGHYPNVTLISYANGTAVRMAISKSKYIVHSVGFKPRNEIEGRNNWATCVRNMGFWHRISKFKHL